MSFHDGLVHFTIPMTQRIRKGCNYHCLCTIGEILSFTKCNCSLHKSKKSELKMTTISVKHNLFPCFFFLFGNQFLLTPMYRLQSEGFSAWGLCSLVSYFATGLLHIVLWGAACRMNKFFLPTSRKVLPTFQIFCPDGVHFAQTVIHFAHFKNQARKRGVLGWGWGCFVFILPQWHITERG